jgi:mRNA interferase MazF
VTCSRYEIVVVPFPFTDRSVNKRRPALALSDQRFSEGSRHTLLAMITSAKNSEWPLDVPLDFAAAGLSAACKVRFKLFTLDNRLVLRRVGILSQSDRRAVEQALRALLAFS